MQLIILMIKSSYHIYLALIRTFVSVRTNIISSEFSILILCEIKVKTELLYVYSLPRY